MLEFFLNDQNSFSAFSLAHLWTILIWLGLTFVVIFSARKFISPKQQTALGLFIGLMTMSWVLIRMYVQYRLGIFNAADDLPLYVCRIVSFAIPFLMINKNKFLFGILYFWIMAGTLNAIVTPDQPIGFPHWTFLFYWLIHAGLISCILYCIFVYRMRPIFKDLVFAFIAANIYLVLIHLYNLWMSTNYSYTMHKPLNPSIIDYFGPWPWYLLTGQLLALILFFVMYLPFWISRKKHIK